MKILPRLLNCWCLVYVFIFLYVSARLRIFLLVLSFIYDFMMSKVDMRIIKGFIKIIKINADSPPSILDGSGEFPS